MNPQRKFIRLTGKLLDSLARLQREKLRQIHQGLQEFNSRCPDVAKNARFLDRVAAKGWFSSAEDIKMELRRDLNDFSQYLQRCRELIQTDVKPLPKFADIYAELVQLEQDFGDLHYDPESNMLSIITDPITLQGISLGSFEIKLLIGEFNNLYKLPPYRVVALDPNPSGPNEEVTHPHVNAERLCEGDGHVPIRSALEQGRFCDFFTIVWTLLNTYNPKSPFVPLDEWQGIACYECGTSVFDDECYYCASCDHHFCSDCTSCCSGCEETVCRECAYECPSCEQSFCHDCTAACDDCEERLCQECLTHGLCTTCLEQRKEADHEEPLPSQETLLAVQSHGVGETPVHA